MSKNTRTRILLTAVAALLLVTMAVGGTMAWLVDSTEQVQNTFTPHNFDITLTEDQPRTYDLIPGESYTKNPKVTVSNNTTKIYLFVKYEEVGNPTNYLTFTNNLIATNGGWTPLTGETGVYYRIVDGNASFDLIAENAVVVKDNIVLVEADEDVPEGGIAMPATTTTITMTYTAYACQYVGFEEDVAGAWAVAQTNGVPTT